MAKAQGRVGESGCTRRAMRQRQQLNFERSRYESAKQIRLGNRELATSILLEAALTRAKETAEWRGR